MIVFYVNTLISATMLIDFHFFRRLIIQKNVISAALQAVFLIIYPKRET